MNIKEIFKQEGLIIPNYNDANFVDLVNALYGKFGYQSKKRSNIEEISKLIPNNKHTLFILLDGTGSNVIDSLSDNSILKNNRKKDILTVSPSTTGCVLTSLATAKYPSEHGIIGWFSYSREFKRDYYPLLFNDRTTGKSLTEFGITPKDIYKEKSILPDLKIDTKIIFPNFINDSIYSKFVINDENRIPYTNIMNAFEIIDERTRKNNETFTYLYIPFIDDISHENGPSSNLIKEKLEEIEKEINKLVKNRNVTIVATADHGQIDITNDVVMDFNKYSRYFYALPGIDFGTATYYVNKENEGEFVNNFNKDFKNQMFLFKTQEFIDNNIFGNTEISPYMKENLGEYISVCKKGYYLINSLKTEDYLGKIKGCHSGFSKEELIIPLIIINSEDFN